MTWSNAKKDAEARAAYVLQRLASGPQPFSKVVPLSDYATAEDFRKILGNEEQAGWSFTYWRMVNRAVVRILKREGLSPQLVKLHADELFTWLLRHGLPNTPQNRAQFVSWKSAQPFHDVKPIPHEPNN